MKSTRLSSGATLFAQEYNALRSDVGMASWLHAHQQLGALALGTNPTNGQTLTFTINGSPVILTAKTVLANPGDFLIQSTPALNAAVIWNALINPTVQTSTYIPVSAANVQLIQYLGWGLPTGGTTITPYSLNTSTAAPLISFTASTTITSGTWTAQTMQLFIEPGTYYIGTTRIFFLGGSTPTFTAPVSNPRIDLVTADSTGTIAVVTGTEASTPVAPAYPANKLVLCEVYHVVGETALYDNENQQSGQGYLSNDSRASLQPIYISSASQVAPNLFIPWISSPVQGDMMYYNGSAWTRLPAGTSGFFLQTQGASANPQWALASGSSVSGAYSVNFAQVCLYLDTSAPNTTSLTPVKLHEIQFPTAMPATTLTIGIRLPGAGAATEYAQVYKNGSPVGALHSVSNNTPTNFTDSISFSGGDLCQVYLYTNNASYAASISEFNVQLLPIPSAYAPTKNS